MSAPNPPAPPALDSAAPRKPLTRARIERLSSRFIAVFGLVFALQVIPSLTDSLSMMIQPWGALRAAAVFACVIWVAVATIVQRGVALSAGVGAICYLVALLTWPLTLVDPTNAPAQPWLWFLCTVATAYAALAFTPLIAGIYTIVTPAAYGALHATEVGGGVGVTVGALDAVYAIILGGALLVLITMLRQAASEVDIAQAAALERYSAVAREHASEAERVQVDALVHDSVLTTLLAAADARTDEAMDVAARMARDAIGHLEASDEPAVSDEVLGLTGLGERVVATARAFVPPFQVTLNNVSDAPIPGIVADALHAAAVQAMVNSSQHAGETHLDRRVAVSGLDAGGVEIIISDDGDGFDPATVAPERLGLRVSIYERVTRAGGLAKVTSSPGNGTTVVLRWPAVDAASDASELSEGTDAS
jgi:signal transduction histidine kinase